MIQVFTDAVGQALAVDFFAPDLMDKNWQPGMHKETIFTPAALRMSVNLLTSTVFAAHRFGLLLVCCRPPAKAWGAVIRPGRRAALNWADKLDRSDTLALFQRPELDIVTYLPELDRLSEIDRVSARHGRRDGVAGRRGPVRRHLLTSAHLH
jgi:hypothetical protein